MSEIKIPDNWQRLLWQIKTISVKRRNKIVQAMIDAVEGIITRSKTHYLTGAALKVRTGRLRSSVTRGPVLISGDVYTAQFGSNVWYGKAWEMGFTIPARTILPVRAKALRFVIDGNVIFSKRANIPARKVAPRKWLQPAVDDRMPNTIKLLESAGVIFEEAI